jgi:hypothetical protein
MPRISEQLKEAMYPDAAEVGSDSEPLDEGAFIVKLMELRHDNYPGRSASGVLPLVVTGHESMDRSRWNDWVRENGVAHYGPAYTERVIQNGIELKEMMPTCGFGRQMRRGGMRSNVRNYSYLDRAGEILVMVEKWPDLYNYVADEMAEQDMTLRQFVDRVYNLPSPLELGRGADTTLGDLLPPLDGMILPGNR